MRTPGEEAMREAARIESAKIYGKTCPEHRPTTNAELAVVRDIAAYARHKATQRRAGGAA
jgi:hypothetical protein